MRYALHLGRVSGISISVHWTFLLLIVWLVWVEMRRDGSLNDMLWLIMFVLTIFVCITLHELGHALTAKRFNINTRDIILLPIGGLARLERMPEKPGQELLVAIAGPLVNVAIVILLLPLVSHQLNEEYLASIQGINAGNFLLNLFLVNIFITIFNMIPAFPMDGGRVLRAALSYGMQRHVATRIAATIGQVLAIVFVFAGFFVNPFLIFIGLFIFLGAQAEADMTESKFALSGYKVHDIRMTNYASIGIRDPLAVPVSMLLDGQCRNFLVMDGDRVAGTLSRKELVKGLAEKGRDAPVESVMHTEVFTLQADMPLDEAYQTMQQYEQALYPVISEGRLAGALDMENILEFIMIRNALAKVKEGATEMEIG